MNRNEKTLAALDAINSRALNDEIEYFLSGNNYYDALTDTENAAESNNDRTILKAARQALISLDVYRTISETELKNTVTSKGKSYDFKMYGRKYIFARHL